MDFKIIIEVFLPWFFSTFYIFFYMLSNKGFNLNHLNHRYNELFNPLKRKKQFLFCVFFFIICLFTYKKGVCILFLTPTLFVISTLILNEIIKKTYNRNIIFPIKGVTHTKMKFLDFFLGSIIIFFSLLTPIFIVAKFDLN